MASGSELSRRAHPAPTPSASELDAELLERCKRGDADAFRAFVLRYQRAVFALVSRLVGPGEIVKDLAQETFLRAYRGFGSYDLDGSAKPSVWLLTIATRIALDTLKRRAVRTVPIELGADAVDGSDPEAERQRSELRVALLEPGAHVRWNGADVTQDRGEATYAVEHGSTLRVHSSGAVVEILDGRVRVHTGQKNSGGGAPVRVLAAFHSADTVALVVAVDGRAVVAVGNGSIRLEAGEAGVVEGRNVHRSSDPSTEEERFHREIKP